MLCTFVKISTWAQVMCMCCQDHVNKGFAAKVTAHKGGKAQAKATAQPCAETGDDIPELLCVGARLPLDV